MNLNKKKMERDLKLLFFFFLILILQNIKFLVVG